MKTINEAVKSKSREELESIARMYYDNIKFQILRDICQKQRNPEYFVTRYHINKEILMREDLFDSKYDEWLQEALERKLNIDKIVIGGLD